MACVLLNMNPAFIVMDCIVYYYGLAIVWHALIFVMARPVAYTVLLLCMR